MSQSKEKYVFVDYIESTGTQWIDTGFVADGNTRVEIDYQLVTIKPSFIFGSRVGGTNRAYTLNISSGGDLVTTYGSTSMVAIATADTLRHKVNKYHRTTYLDGALVSQTAKQTFTCPGSLELFACYNNGTKDYLPSVAKIYSCHVYDNGALVRNFVPCYRKADKEAGLFDLVSGTFYENQGTGEFLIGGEI